jgi:hypothetical protein
MYSKKRELAWLEYLLVVIIVVGLALIIFL